MERLTPGARRLYDELADLAVSGTLSSPRLARLAYFMEHAGDECRHVASRFASNVNAASFEANAARKINAELGISKELL